VNADHDAAMKCYEIQERAAYLVFVFERISHADEEIHAENLGDSSQEAADVLKALEELYAKWYATATECLQVIERAEAEGFEVDGSDAFRRYHREARGVLTPDEEFFQGDKLVELRDEAIDANQKEDVEPPEG
jgi:hypothetical protein